MNGYTWVVLWCIVWIIIGAGCCALAKGKGGGYF